MSKKRPLRAKNKTIGNIDKLAELALTPGTGALAGLTVGTAYDVVRNGMKGKPLQGHPITVGLITGFATGLGKQIYDSYSKSYRQKSTNKQ